MYDILIFEEYDLLHLSNPKTDCSRIAAFTLMYSGGAPCLWIGENF